MPQNPELSPQTETHEAPQLTGAHFADLLNRYQEMVQHSPYRDGSVQSPAQAVYSEMAKGIDQDVALTPEQAQVAQYLAAETSLLETQMLVDARVINDPDKFEEAVYQVNDIIVEILEQDKGTLSDDDIAATEAQVAALDTVIDRIETSEGLPNGTELLEYMKSVNFTNTIVSNLDGMNPEWIAQVRGQKKIAVEEALKKIEAEWQVNIILSQKYPSNLASL